MRDHGSLVDLLRWRASEQPNAPAFALLSDGANHEQAMTFEVLEQRSQALAERLVAQVHPGDRVLLIFPTSLEFIVAYFACLIVGAIAVPMMPPRRNAARDAHITIIADCTPRLALTKGISKDGAAALGRSGVSCLSVDLAQLDAVVPHLAGGTPARHDVAFLQYTSGSTSAPKGVMVSHDNLLQNLEMVRTAFGNHAGSTHVSWLPLYHDMGLILNVLQSIYLGALCVLMTPVGFVHRPLEWLRAIHHYRGEVAAAPNFAFDLCVDRFRPDQMHGIDLSSWKIACNGAEPIRMETMRRFADTFAPYGFAADTLYPAYGLAEATLFVSGGHRGRGVVSRTASSRALQDGRIEQPTGPNDERRLVGCGRPANGLTVAIVDPTRKRQVAPDVIGEIWITGPSVARGYWGRPETSAAVFRAELDGARGGAWLRTGDLGCVDAQGELYVTGRLKDVIIIRGANHYPQDIEATVARSHPALRRDCGAAFSVADGNGDEKLVVVQEVKRGWRGVVTVEDIVASIRAALANEHEVMARAVVLIEAATIPKTTSGKLQRTLTAKQWAEGKLKLWSGPQPPAADTVTSADL